MSKLLVIVLLLTSSVAAACASEGENQTTSAPECASQLKWTGGNEGSEFMNPGQDCVACHKKEGEGPAFQAAGTVFGKFDEVDLCEGKSGITVEITDKTGKVFTATSNASGNFFVSASAGTIAMPYTARIKAGGKERAMLSPQSSGACNSCHTKTGGSTGAPGRIVIPGV
ncbi:MAG: hypothetical protein HYZ27_07745 [Deltaproteobacteria bacterium]|nr:hypothetical protein [Deltaproteobacteria bacterium]